MPTKPPHACACGKVVPAGGRCACTAARDRERRARHDARRPSSSGRGYTGTWERARREFLDANPFCVRCGARATVVDHRIPHRGDSAKFWDRTNWQAMCARDHNSAKQREERRAMKGLTQ